MTGFAAQRGLPVGFLESHGIHVCPDDGDRPGWIVIPYPHLTGFWYNRYRNPAQEGTPKYWARGGSAVHLYNPQRLGPNADVVFFTEGEIDCLVMTYLGYPAIGLQGTGTTGRLHSNWRLLFDDTNIVVAFDADAAGRAAAERVVAAFEPRAIDLCPPTGMDLNDWFLADREGLVAAADATLKSLG